MTNKKIPIKSTPHAPASTHAAKQTLYIDAEDEITGIIDKVATSESNIIAVVLPKHSSVFQSIVNMKLLKRAATQAKKHLVLITSDASVMPIAATVGIHVAKTPSSKPEIPSIPVSNLPSAKDDDIENNNDIEANVESVSAAVMDDDPIELDNTTDGNLDSVTSKKDKKSKKEKKFSIPDFSSFRLKLFLGSSLVIGLVVLWVFGFVILPQATVTVTTDTQSAPVNALITLQTGIDDADIENGILPAKRAQVEKTEEATVPATGEKNIGQKATGLMNLTNCINDGEDKIVPAGTAFSSGDKTFTTTEAVTLDFAVFAGNNCLSNDFGRDKDVPVIAVQPGPEYNLDARSYNSSISGIQAFGSAMSGGTTEVVTVISQEDVDRAKQQSSGSSKSTAIEELQNQLKGQDVTPIDESLTESEPTVDISPAVGAEATDVTVKTTINYALIGVNEGEVSSFLDKNIQDSLTDQDKNIRDNGLSNAIYKLSDRPDESRTIFTIETIGSVGPEFNIDELKESIAGKKRGDIENQIEAIDGVRSVSVEYSPGWITTTPKSAEKIDIVFNEQDDQ